MMVKNTKKQVSLHTRPSSRYHRRGAPRNTTSMMMARTTCLGECHWGGQCVRAPTKLAPLTLSTVAGFQPTFLPSATIWNEHNAGQGGMNTKGSGQAMAEQLGAGFVSRCHGGHDAINVATRTDMPTKQAPCSWANGNNNEGIPNT